MKAVVSPQPGQSTLNKVFQIQGMIILIPEKINNKMENKK